MRETSNRTGELTWEEIDDSGRQMKTKKHSFAFRFENIVNKEEEEQTAMENTTESKI